MGKYFKGGVGVEFKCDMCGGTFEDDWTNEEQEDEFIRLNGASRDD